MPFLPKNRNTYKGRLKDENCESHIVTMSTTDYATAVKVEEFGKQLTANRRWDIIGGVLDDKYTLADAYDRRRDLDAFLADRAAPDLDPLVDEWRPHAADDRYYAQVRAFIPKGVRFPVADFRLANIGKFLKALPVSIYTKRRYKVALSAFAKYLIQLELLESNPVRDVDLGRVKAARPVIRLDGADVCKLVEAIDNPKYQAMEALMAGTGMEGQAVRALHRRDVDIDRRIVFARGEKNRYRTRWVEFTEDWAWEIFSRYIRPFTPDAQPFAAVDWHWFLKSHHDAAERKAIRWTTPHHHRHSYAVMWLPRCMAGEGGRDLSWLKNQLGHAPQSNMIHTTYAVEIKAVQLTRAQQDRLAAVPEKRSKGTRRRR